MRRQSKEWSAGTGRPRPGWGSRPGFTLVEITAAVVILGMALVLVAEVAVWVLQERARLADYQGAQELAANVLERARAQPWNDLTPEWAGRQRLPEPYRERGWTLEVRVAPEELQPLAKRVTATVKWKTGSKPPQSLEVTALFANRSTGAKGEKP